MSPLPPHAPPRRSSRVAAIAVAAALALLAAQWLGLAHRVRHAPGIATAAAAFANHDADAGPDCRLYDHASHADALAAGAAALALPPPEPAAAAGRASVAAHARIAGALARGPPVAG